MVLARMSSYSIWFGRQINQNWRFNSNWYKSQSLKIQSQLQKRQGEFDFNESENTWHLVKEYAFIIYDPLGSWTYWDHIWMFCWKVTQTNMVIAIVCYLFSYIYMCVQMNIFTNLYHHETIGNPSVNVIQQNSMVMIITSSTNLLLQCTLPLKVILSLYIEEPWLLLSKYAVICYTKERKQYPWHILTLDYINPLYASTQEFEEFEY